MSERKLVWLYRAVAVVVLVCAWWLAASVIGRNLIPTPLATWQSATTLFAEPEIYEAVGNSLYVYLGGLLATYGNTFRMGPYFVVVLTLAVLGVSVTELLRLFERRLDRWRRP